MTDKERIARGHRAASELKTTEEAFAAVRQHYLETMLSATDPAEIIRLHQCVGTVELVRKALTLAVSDGLIAASAAAQL